MTDWYTTFFDALANDFWDGVMPAEVTAADVAFLESVLALSEPARLLDVPSGSGRHALALARAGHAVTAVDISSDAIARLRARADAERLAVTAVCSDMRALPAAEPFDAAYCFGNAFGYFDVSGLRMFVAGVAAALRVGGRFVLDTSAAAECILPALSDGDRYEGGGVEMTSTHRYVAEESRLETTYRFRRGDDEVSTRVTSQWVLTAGEIRRLLEDAGFVVEATYGSTEQDPFDLGSGRLLIVSRRDG